MIRREAEHDRVVSFLDALERGPRSLVLTGEAGIGKTTVWEGGRVQARERGYGVVSFRSDAGEIRLAYAGLGDLLEPLVEDVRPRLTEPQRRAVDGALGCADPGDDPDPRLLGIALLEALRGAAGERPLLVALDDMQWLDEPSAAALAYAFRRLADENVGLLATVRSGTWGSRPELERALGGSLAQVEIGPLDLAATQRLLRERLATPIAPSAAHAIHECSGGNPFFALELARAMVVRGELRLPDSLRSLVSERIERMPADTRALLVALASAAQPTAALVRELDGEEALEPAEREGIVIVEGGRLRFSHPLLAAAVRDGATERERRAAHRRLAALVGDPEGRVRHEALAADGADERIALALDAAAAAALARGSLIDATELAEQALALTPPVDAAAVQRRRIQAARCHQIVGDARRQRELLEQALAGATREHERAEPLWQLATVTMQAGGDVTQVAAMVEEALACAAGDDGLSAAIILGTGWLEPHFVVGPERAQTALEHAERAGDRALQATAVGFIAGARFTRGQGLQTDLFERAMALERDAGYIDADARPTTLYGWCAKWAGEIELARELLERSAAEGLKANDANASTPLFYLAWLHVITGEWERAIERTDEARLVGLDAGRAEDVGWSEITGAVAQALQGRLQEARAALERTAPHAANAGVLWAYGTALVALAEGDPGAAAAALGPEIAASREAGIEEPGLYPWFPTYAEALVGLGRLDEAQELATWMHERAERLGRRWALAMCAHVRGAVAAERGDFEAAVAALAAALDLHDGLGRPFDRACTLLAYGRTLRRAKRKRPAREALEEALAEFERLGAAPSAQRARAELERIGGRAPRPGALTPTEERVAALVATGMSNKQVAAELFVTVRTVETTLSRIFAKLGVHSRTELAARHGEQ